MLLSSLHTNTPIACIMKQKWNLFLFLFFIILISSLHVQAQPQTALPQLGKNSVQEVVAAMTLDEKAHLVVGMGMSMAALPASMTSLLKDSGAKKAFTPPASSGGPVIGQTMNKVPGVAGTTFAIPRLNIPSIAVADGPAGLRIQPIRNGDSSKTYYATAFPVATLLASTWDTALVKKVGEAFGNEIHEYGVDIILAPALNIHRNPLNGRNFEYYSEDPLIAGSMTSAIVNGIQSNGVGTSIKHFAANNQETNRNTVDVIVSERALREIYLKGFEMAVKASQPWTVMSSYNKINGTYASESRGLLTTILRDEWHFAGFVMTDWFGGKDAVAQMKAGNDLLMPGTGAQSKAIVDAVNGGQLSVQQLDENVARILTIILKSPTFNQYKFSDKPDLIQHAAIARTAAAEGMILLKNESNTLPLTGNKKIALFGNASYGLIAGGTGSGEVNKAYTTSLLQGLSNAGFSADDELQKMYPPYIADAKVKQVKPKGMFAQPPPIPEMAASNEIIEKKATDDDVAIITIGRNAGEGSDRKTEDDYYFTDAEKSLIKNVSAAFHLKNKKVIVILNVGGVVDVPTWRAGADAILLSWQPGMEAGNAIADVVSGKVNPCGRLATTFPMKYEDVPSVKNFPGKEFPEKAVTGNFGMKQIPAEVTYEEGIYVGYRYYNTFSVKPAYEFGYGLSYTNFSFSNLKLSSSSFKQTMTATVTVTNTGKTPGKEVVQLYITAPAKTMDKPSEELKAFAKTDVLQSGQSQTITFTIHAADLASFDTKTTSWIAEKGSYQIKVGASSLDIKQTASFTLANDIITEKDNKVLEPGVSINEMKNKQ